MARILKPFVTAASRNSPQDSEAQTSSELHSFALGIVHIDFTELKNKPNLFFHPDSTALITQILHERLKISIKFGYVPPGL